jgi:HPt (histidine-containing phosphotransfer) domain-containing protein
VALTAHAMAGDRERCLDAGMTAYLVKPLQPQQLIETVESLAQAAPGANSGRADRREPPRDDVRGTTLPTVEPVVDEADALKLAGGDQALVRELAQLFLKELPGKLAELRDAAAAGDPERVRIAAHALKGSAAAVGGRAASDASSRVEHLGRSGNLEAARQSLGDLEATLEQLVAALHGSTKKRRRAGGTTLKGRPTKLKRGTKAGR